MLKFDFLMNDVTRFGSKFLPEFLPGETLGFAGRFCDDDRNCCNALDAGTPHGTQLE